MDFYMVFSALSVLLLCAVCMFVSHVFFNKAHDWKWGFLNPGDDYDQNKITRVGAMVRILCLWCLLITVLTVLGAYLPFHTIRPMVMIPNCGLLSLYLFGYAGNCQGKHNLYREKTKWSWIPLPQWYQEDNTHNMKGMYRFVFWLIMGGVIVDLTTSSANYIRTFIVWYDWAMGALALAVIYSILIFAIKLYCTRKQRRKDKSFAEAWMVRVASRLAEEIEEMRPRGRGLKPERVKELRDFLELTVLPTLITDEALRDRLLVQARRKLDGSPS